MFSSIIEARHSVDAIIENHPGAIASGEDGEEIRVYYKGDGPFPFVQIREGCRPYKVRFYRRTEGDDQSISFVEEPRLSSDS